MLEEDALFDEEVEYKDEGYIELVMNVLARMCDGQFTGLQVWTGYSYQGRGLRNTVHNFSVGNGLFK